MISEVESSNDTRAREKPGGVRPRLSKRAVACVVFAVVAAWIALTPQDVFACFPAPTYQMKVGTEAWGISEDVSGEWAVHLNGEMTCVIPAKESPGRATAIFTFTVAIPLVGFACVSLGALAVWRSHRRARTE